MRQHDAGCSQLLSAFFPVAGLGFYTRLVLLHTAHICVGHSDSAGKSQQKVSNMKGGAKKTWINPDSELGFIRKMKDGYNNTWKIQSSNIYSFALGFAQHMLDPVYHEFFKYHHQKYDIKQQHPTSTLSQFHSLTVSLSHSLALSGFAYTSYSIACFLTLSRFACTSKCVSVFLFFPPLPRACISTILLNTYIYTHLVFDSSRCII